jgi:uncharacterized protein DUF4440
MREATRLAIQRWLLGVLWVGVLFAIVAQSRAQPAPVGDEASILSADESLSAAMSAGDKSVARKLLSLQFTFVDEYGKVYGRKEFLTGLKDVAAAAARDVSVKIYGRVATVTGHRNSARGDDVFFLNIWAKQKGAWRALVSQDVALAAAGTPEDAPAPATSEVPYDCRNPCQTIPYRVRSPAEQDVVNSFQAIEKAAVGHDADGWSKHIADEFVLYASHRAPAPKSSRVAAIERQKQNNTAVRVGEIETMRLAVYDDGAAMIATHDLPDNSRPPYHAARVWVKRNGQWQVVISVQTEVKAP